MAKRLVVCFDGTWNTPDEDGDIDGNTSTNVHKFYEAVLPRDAGGTEQVKRYDEGVGTKWYEKVRGGAFGVGLSENIQEGYRFLVDRYEEGDEVFILGFSRGGYTARSLVGMIRNAGLLKPAHKDLTSEAYSLYRTRDGSADTENAVFFRREFSREIRIHFLGVWDTVGALGIPLQSFEWFNRGFYQFHDTELSGIVANAYHAVAIDEHRENYTATLWDPKEKPNQTVEQVWFVGAHANVGGGYPDCGLSDVTLDWMMKKTSGCGLALDPAKAPRPAPDVAGLAVRDSYKEFLGGLYGLVSPRRYRTIGHTLYGAESLDTTVFERLSRDPDYRPKNPVGEHARGARAGRLRG
ncbi:MAG: DUF2235 domain-containing protein [Candidatus Tectomicrobia bacterium]|uniref:DUF2235 domain-containing protein n=1 Tax=Tectimicrobiota bacterium TaxID=2528274 RepID=A0A932I4N9_UNCTE|nr:DUF2235 domain-containing protein [Candidatus Tectomicrobia bacterium]